MSDAKRGFATMSPERLRELGSMGGKACPASARTFSNREKAVEAGKKGAAARIANMWKAKQNLLEKNND
jgi:general stress protein YciG